MADDPPKHDPAKQALRDALYARYDAAGLEHGEALHGESFLRNVLLYAELDDSWTDQWVSFVYGYVYGRQVLDVRARVLVVIGEAIAAGHYSHLTHHMNTAVKHGIGPAEILEVCLLASLCAGLPSLRPTISAYQAGMSELGLTSPPQPAPAEPGG